MTNKKIVIPTLIALVAIVAVGISPAVLAESGMKGHFKHLMDLPDLEFTEDSIPVGENHFENAQNVIPITDALNSIGDGQVLQIGLKPIQEHIVYGAMVLSDDTVFGVIVDAGTGDVLYQGEGKSIEEIEAKIAEMKTRFADGDFGKFHGMDGDYQKSFGMHKGIGDYDRTEKLEQKLAEPTGNPELDALRAQFVEKFHELKDAIANEDSDSVQELRDELKDLRNQMVDLK